MDFIPRFIVSIPIIVIVVFVNSYFGHPIPSRGFVIVGLISYILGHVLLLAIKKLKRR